MRARALSLPVSLSLSLSLFPPLSRPRIYSVANRPLASFNMPAQRGGCPGKYATVRRSLTEYKSPRYPNHIAANANRRRRTAHVHQEPRRQIRTESEPPLVRQIQEKEYLPSQPCHNRRNTMQYDSPPFTIAASGRAYSSSTG